jgi:hypothetical protein
VAAAGAVSCAAQQHEGDRGPHPVCTVTWWHTMVGLLAGSYLAPP